MSDTHSLAAQFVMPKTETRTHPSDPDSLAKEILAKLAYAVGKDPLAVYGTNCFKFGTESQEDARAWLTRELHIVQPKLVVAMGEKTVSFLDNLGFPLADAVEGSELGVVRRLTPTVEVLLTPDVDASLDEQDAKTEFWNAFKALGPWWAEQPPY